MKHLRIPPEGEYRGYNAMSVTLAGPKNAGEKK